MEDWKPIPGYEDRYEVSSYGKVLRVPRSDYRGYRFSGRIKKHQINRSGHHYVVLFRDGQAKHMYVHRLVLMAFVGQPMAGQEACHNDGNPDNNYVGNLRWDSSQMNSRDAVRQRKHRNSRKEYCPRGHRLSGANLKPAELKRGHRDCWACDRERTFAWKRKIAFDPERADANYKSIVAEGEIAE